MIEDYSLQDTLNVNFNVEQIGFYYSLIDDIWNNYNNLIHEIEEYRFNARRDNTYSDLQYKTNKKILSEILEFRPVVVYILQNIDNYMKCFTQITNNDTFNRELDLALTNIDIKLSDALNKLSNAKDIYHKTWNNVNRASDYMWYPEKYIGNPEYYRLSDHELGDAKKEWRLYRNEACNCISDFYKQLKTINVSIFNNETNKISNLYRKWIQGIIKSPNYFCYLNNTEKEEIERQKLLKKKK